MDSPSLDAPLRACVLVIGYNRPSHFERVVRAVYAQCTLPLCIVLDAPDSPKVEASQHIMLHFLGTLNTPPLMVTVTPEHLGNRRCVQFAIDLTLTKACAVIVLEDDCLPLPGFFPFMEEAIQRFEGDASIRSICGYLPPITDVHRTAQHSRRFIPWGWATWRSRWQDGWRDGEYSSLRHTTHLPADLAKIAVQLSPLEEDNDIWSWRWALSHYRSSTVVAYPSQSYVHNIGFDGSGTHSGNTLVFDSKESEAVTQTRDNLCSTDDPIELFMEHHSDLANFGRCQNSALMRNREAST